METCRIDVDLVRELAALSNKLNTLSPTWVRSAEEREEIQQRREVLQVEIKQHRKKGHDGKPCPAFGLHRVAPRAKSFGVTAFNTDLEPYVGKDS